MFQRTLARLSLCSLLVLLFIGCSGGGGTNPLSDPVVGFGGGVTPTGNPSPVVTPPPTGGEETAVPKATIRLEQVLARAIPGRVAQQRFLGRDSQGDLTFGPVTVPKSAVVILSEVPVTTTVLEMVLLDGEEVVGRASVSVTLTPEETLSLRDIDFEFVSARLTELRLSPASSTVSAGYSVDLSASGLFEDGTERELTDVQWSTLPLEVASIDSSGRVTGLKPGNATVYATSHGTTVSATIEVTAAVPLSLSVLPESAETVLDPVQFRCLVTYSDGTELDLTEGVTWQLNEQQSARLPANNGLVQPVAGVNVTIAGPLSLHLPYTVTRPGEVTVTATLGELSAHSTLTVNRADTVTSLKLRERNSISAPGTQRRYSLIASFSDQPTRDITEEAEWSVESSEDIVSLGNGVYRFGAEVPHGTIFRPAARWGYQSISPGDYVERLLYVSSDGNDQTHSFKVDRAGALTPLDEGPSGNGPRGLAMHPSGRAVFSLNLLAGTITLHVGGSNGQVSNRYAYASNVSPSSAVVTADGESLLVATSRGILRFQARQAAQWLPNTPVSAAAVDIALDPLGRFLYACNGSLGVYSLDDPEARTYPLLETVEATASDTLSFAAPHPSGDYLYTISSPKNRISSFSVASDGTLSLLGTLATGAAPRTLAVHPSGRFVYVSHINDTKLSLFEVGANGALTARSSLTVPIGGRSVAIDPGGKFLYLTNNLVGTVTSYAIGAEGGLTQIDQESVSGALDVVTTP